LACITFTACEDDPENPAFGKSDIPRILFDWQSTVTLRLNDSLVLAPQISPSDGVTYEWRLDNKVVSNDRVVRLKFTKFGQYQLDFKVKRDTVTNSRTAQVAIQKASFEPRAYTKKVIGFISPTAKLEDIQWDKITHLVISSAQVGVNGVDTVLNAADPKNTEMKKIIFMAYNYGVYVMLDLTGTIANYTNCGGYYANYDFYNNIANPDKRTALIKKVAQFIRNNKFDGLNIYLNNISEGNAFADPESVTTFFNDMHAELTLLTAPKGQMFYSASVPTGWTASVLSMVATNENFDWVNIYGFASQDLSPIPSSPAWYLNDAIASWRAMGVPASKIVGGIPAFGRSYNFPDGVTITWGNVDNYASWISYKDVLALNTDAATLNPSQFNVTAKTGVFYDGFSNVEAKAQYIKDNNMAGVAVWSIDNDSSDPAKSLLKRAYDNLNTSN
jgi:chitinase